MCSAKVKNEWEYATTATLCLHGAYKHSLKPYSSILEGMVFKFMVSLNYFKFTGWFKSLTIHRMWYLSAPLVTGLFAVVPWSGLHGRPTWFLLEGGWGHLNAMVYQVEIENTDHLKESIKEACARIIPDVFKWVRHEWEWCIHIYYLCNGIHVQHMFQWTENFPPNRNFWITLYYVCN